MLVILDEKDKFVKTGKIEVRVYASKIGIECLAWRILSHVHILCQLFPFLFQLAEQLQLLRLLLLLESTVVL